MSESEAAAEIARRGLRLWTDCGFVLIGKPGAPFAARGSTAAEALARLMAQEAPPARPETSAPENRQKEKVTRKREVTLFDSEE